MKRRTTLLLVVGVLLTGVVAFVFGSTLVASATTGNPNVTVIPVINGSGKLIVSGQYSDPEGVCDLNNRPVTITTRTGSYSGSVVNTSTTNTGATGAYTKNTLFTVTSGTTYYITVVVTGKVNGSYGATDVCPDATGQAQITAP
jgi:MFS superfamily sulfate permease-like transporter